MEESGKFMVSSIHWSLHPATAPDWRSWLDVYFSISDYRCIQQVSIIFFFFLSYCSFIYLFIDLCIFRLRCDGVDSWSLGSINPISPGNLRSGFEISFRIGRVEPFCFVTDGTFWLDRHESRMGTTSKCGKPLAEADGMEGFAVER